MALSTANSFSTVSTMASLPSLKSMERAGVSILGRDDHGQRTLVRRAGLARLGGVHDFRKRKGVVAAAINLKSARRKRRIDDQGFARTAKRRFCRHAPFLVRHLDQVADRLGLVIPPAAFSAAIKFRVPSSIGLRPSDNRLRFASISSIRD